MPQTPRLYDELHHLWPVLSPPEDYAAEASLVGEVLSAYLGEGRLSLLELGAGGGHTLYHLRSDHDCAAVDLSPRMLELCQRLNPGLPTHVGDMRSVRLGRTFDAVLVHDAIDYMTSEQDVLAALTTAREHLRPGGVVVVAPTYTAETFSEHEAALDQRETEGGLHVTFVSYVHDPDPDDAVFEMAMVLLLRQIDGTLEIEEDRHACGLFAADQWQALLAKAGLEVEVLEAERPGAGDDDAPGPPWTLFVGRRR